MRTIKVSTPSSRQEIVGFKQQLNTDNSDSVYKFLSVPYAEAPVGEQRFQRPVPLRQLATALVNATSFKPTCPQFRHLEMFISPLLSIDHEHRISEDCLHLHIYVPENVSPNATTMLTPDKQLPVIVWIPGEGFDYADARQFDGSYLAQLTQSIVVSVQYRVGVLGFLHAPELDIHGNMGLYDQIMALNWVHENIVAFGGDSKRVTVMGRFSGSMSISALITAPNQSLLMSRIDSQEPLFSRAALLSGIAVDEWIIDARQHERAAQLFDPANNNSLVAHCAGSNQHSCLKNVPLQQLLESAGHGWRLIPDGELVVRHGSPADAIQQGRFSTHLDALMLGETGTEGTLCLYRHLLMRNKYANLIEKNKLTRSELNDVIRDDSITYYKHSVPETSPIRLSMDSFIGDATADADKQLKLRDLYLNACSAYMVKSHSERIKRNILDHNHRTSNSKLHKPIQVYHYELKYKPTFSLAPEYIRTAAHGDDIPLIFGLVHQLPKLSIDPADLKATQRMMAYVGNFVHGNNPSLTQNPSITNDDTYSDAEFPMTLAKRSWMNEVSLDLIDVSSDSEPSKTVAPHHALGKLNSESKFRVVYLDGATTPQQTDSNDIGVPNQRILQRLMYSPEQLLQRGNSLIEDQPSIEQSQYAASRRSSTGALLSAVLAHQQQQQQPIGHSMPQQLQLSTMTILNEQPVSALLLSTACLVILILTSLCLGLWLIVMRAHSLLQVDASVIKGRHDNNTCGAHNSIHQSDAGCSVNMRSVRHGQHDKFAGSASLCNICVDDSPSSSIDAVLNAAAIERKDARGFSNVFAKLKNHHEDMQTATATQAHQQTQQQQIATSQNLPDLHRNSMQIETKQHPAQQNAVIPH